MMRGLQLKDSSAVLNTLTDAEIVQAMHLGHLSALAVLYQRYGEVVYRLALRMLGNSHEAEDLTQEVFLAFWRAKTYDASRGSVLVFLLTITRSQALNRIKQAKSHRQRLLRWQSERLPKAHNVPLETVSLEELAQQVSSALGELPDNQRLILEMAYYEGLSHTEITERLQIPLGTVKTRSRLGLLKLRQRLKDWMD